MDALQEVAGIVVPLDRANVDTDQVIPKQFLKSIQRKGFGDNLFDGWRYLDEGYIGKNPNQRRLNPDFVLNQARYRGGRILLARDNFGCGSSREHAVWALEEHGFRCVIAPSFADIFFSNCIKNGVLPVVLPGETVDELFAVVARTPSCKFNVVLDAQHVVLPDGSMLAFEIDSFSKHCLLNGLDDIDLTLADEHLVRAYEIRRRVEVPWLFADLGSPSKLLE